MNQAFKAVSLIAATCLVPACMSDRGAQDEAPRYTATPSAIDDQSRDLVIAQTENAGITSIDQIGPGEGEALRQLQVALAGNQQASMEQLRIYKDLCADAVQPPDGIDCSEMRLQIERAFKTEDDFDRALLLLDSLTRQSGIETDSRFADSVRDGRNYSYAPDMLLGQDQPVPEPDPTTLQDLPADAQAAIEAIVVTRQP